MEVLERPLAERTIPISPPLSRETSITRAVPAIEVIRKELLGKVGNPHILVVGVGLDAGVIQCPYVPYRIASVFEQADVPFNLTLLDCDPDIRWDIADRKQIFLPHRYYSTPEVQQEWQSYLADTSQADSVIHKRVPGLRFEYDEYSEGEADEDDFYTDYLTEGIHIAEIPENFRAMRDSRALRILIEDVSQARPDPESVDYIDIMNVFYMLDIKRQLQTLSSLSRGLKSGGLIGLNDLQRNPIFKDIGGWMARSSLKEFGLETVKFDLSTEYTESQDSAEPNTIIALFRKK